MIIFKFENLADDEETNWLGSGISETLISKLSNVDEINVIERTHLNKIMEEQKLSLSGVVGEETSIELGKIVGANVAVIGSFQVVGEILRISGRFVNIETGEVLRSAVVTGKMDDFFTMQDNLVKNLLSNQKIEISEEVVEIIEENKTEELTKVEWFAKGYEASVKGKYEKAIEFYKEEIRINPEDADTYNNMGIIYYLKGDKS